MKTKIFILKPDNTFYIVNKNKIKGNTVEIDGNTYIIESGSIFYKINKKLFDGQKFRAIFYSEAQINPVKSDGKKVEQRNYLLNTTTENDRIYQELLHYHISSDILLEKQPSVLMYLVLMGLMFFLGIVVMAAIGHIRL